MAHRSVRVLAGIVFSFAVSPFAQSQTTVQKADVEAIFSLGTVISLYSDTSGVSSVNVGQKGGPQIFDFSNLQFDRLFTDTIFSVSSRPGLASRYPATTIGFDFPEEVGFESLLFGFTTTTLNNVGDFRQLAGDTVRYRHSTPAETFISFPVMMNDSLTYTTTVIDTTYAGQSFVSSNTSGLITVTNVVDAYGTLKLSGNFSVPSLRMRTYENQPHNFKGFRYITSSGIILFVESLNTQPDTGLVALDGPVFYITNGSVTSVQNQTQVPAILSLEQNYPNPFNPTTVIRYQLSVTSSVRLSVYDVLGRELATLVNRELPAGFHSAEWSAEGSSGVYFYKIEAVGVDGKRFVETKKMILLR